MVWQHCSSMSTETTQSSRLPCCFRVTSSSESLKRISTYLTQLVVPKKLYLCVKVSIVHAVLIQCLYNKVLQRYFKSLIQVVSYQNMSDFKPLKNVEEMFCAITRGVGSISIMGPRILKLIACNLKYFIILYTNKFRLQNKTKHLSYLFA